MKDEPLFRKAVPPTKYRSRLAAAFGCVGGTVD
jgi:hypothetical protein